MLSVPSLDMGELGQPGGLARLAAQLDAGLSSTGFITLRNHGVDPVVVDAAFSAAKSFFALDAAAKEQMAGYTLMADIMRKVRTHSLRVVLACYCARPELSLSASMFFCLFFFSFSPSLFRFRFLHLCLPQGVPGFLGWMKKYSVPETERVAVNNEYFSLNQHGIFTGSFHAVPNSLEEPTRTPWPDEDAQPELNGFRCAAATPPCWPISFNPLDVTATGCKGASRA